MYVRSHLSVDNRASLYTNNRPCYTTRTRTKTPLKPEGPNETNSTVR